jgi:hypothetical protein
MSKIEYYIGIDPDVQASGLGVWDTKAKKLIQLTCEDLTDLCATLLSWHQSYVVKVRLEAGWLATGLNWHYGGKRSGNDVGRNHEIGRQIEKYCIKYNIPYELVKPLGYSSWNHRRFCQYTGWPTDVRTNPDKRVAGLLVYGF